MKTITLPENPTIEVQMCGGTIETIWTNIEGLGDVDVIFTETEDANANEVYVEPGTTTDTKRFIYTVAGIEPDAVDLTPEIEAAAAYGNKED